jgi:hypothetical protein
MVTLIHYFISMLRVMILKFARLMEKLVILMGKFSVVFMMVEKKMLGIRKRRMILYLFCKEFEIDYKFKKIIRRFVSGDVSLSLSMEVLGYAVGGGFTLDTFVVADMV